MYVLYKDGGEKWREVERRETEKRDNVRVRDNWKVGNEMFSYVMVTPVSRIDFLCTHPDRLVGWSCTICLYM